MDIICILLKLAEHGALYQEQKFTTIALSKELGTTQQTMSNVLIKLEEKQLIKRETSLKGLHIIITKEGKDLLKNYKKKFDSIFKKTDTILGKVVTGMGEGKFYIQQKKYKSQFKELIDIDPFEGTLNMEIDTTEKNKFLNDKKPINIEGFQTEDRTFGPIECHPVKINGFNAAIIIPKRTHHKENIIEIIAEVNLREKLGLTDGSTVKINEK